MKRGWRPFSTCSVTAGRSLLTTPGASTANRFGINELYYRLKLINARIAKIDLIVPHVITSSQGQPEESLSLTYESVNWEHCIAGTSAYSLWEERIF